VTKKRTLVSFDWAIKRLLRQKANFVILEGFLSELLKDDIVINQILESDGNQEDENDKYNRLDILCNNDKDELIAIELQYYADRDYFQRMLYGASKLITEYLYEGDEYSKARKVFSINILYFDLGIGKDYIYKGKMAFKGMHNHDELNLSEHQQKRFKKESPGDLYPEYYVIKVNNFDNVAKDTLDEWIYYLKNTALPDRYSAKGLKNVEQFLNYDKMDAIAKKLYDKHKKELLVSYSVIETAKDEGEIKGKVEVVLNSYDEGLDKQQIAKITKFTEGEVDRILREHGKIV